MIKKIHINRYKKMSNIDFEFIKGINVISGANGTCKTSILHLITNALQSKSSSTPQLKSCIQIIRMLNDNINLKVEKLTRGDKIHNNPCGDHSGILLDVEYFENGKKLNFRKHNSSEAYRYRIIPKYAKGSADSLPAAPVIYLGLNRLLPFGEFQDDTKIKKISRNLPDPYKQDIITQYKLLTGINIPSIAHHKMGNVKKRADFTSTVSGIDSNTISAGEDNIYIILTALSSLKYYHDSLGSTINDTESILLIDELDATLHPSMQIKILELFKTYSEQFKIQIFFTTHSLSLIEETLKKDNVIYLVDQVTNVQKMDSPNIYKIKMHLEGLTHRNIYENKKIPIFTEDVEARCFLDLILEYFMNNKISDGFNQVKSFFHLVNCKIGADNLKTIFNDEVLLKSTTQLICILDGDKTSDLKKNIVKLPGTVSPEKLIFEYTISLFNATTDSFFSDQFIISQGYNKAYFRDNIKPDIDKIESELQSLKSQEKTTKGISRTMSKDIFNKHCSFFKLAFKHWINDPINKLELEDFYKDLNKLFKKTAHCYMISSDLWNVN